MKILSSLFVAILLVSAVLYVSNTAVASTASPSLISPSGSNVPVTPTFKFTPAESGQDDFQIQILQGTTVVRDFLIHCSDPVNTGYTLNPFIVGQDQLSNSTEYKWKCKAVEGTDQNYSGTMDFVTQ